MVLGVGAQVSVPSCLVSTGIDVTLLCQHGGLCVDEEDKHYCHCQAGYTGSYCEDEVDECSPNPCQNGATCTDYLGGFSCKVWAVLGWPGGYWHECCCRRAFDWEPVYHGRLTPMSCKSKVSHICTGSRCITDVLGEEECALS